MADERASAVAPFGQVRRIYWVVLAAALVVAMAIPAVTFWHASGAPLRVRAYVSPANPRIGEPIRVVVEPLDSTDATATEGPWAHVVIRWDMMTMTMNRPEVSAPGQPGSKTLSVTLRPDMAGAWWARVTLQTPGRPAWQTFLRFVVISPQASSGNGSASSEAVPLALSMCAACGTGVVSSVSGGCLGLQGDRDDRGDT